LITTVGSTLITKCSRFSSFNYKRVFISIGHGKAGGGKCLLWSPLPHEHPRRLRPPPSIHSPQCLVTLTAALTLSFCGSWFLGCVYMRTCRWITVFPRSKPPSPS
jgi:hypothetical protein